MNYGYARVSTDGQSVDAQVKQLARRRSREGLSRDGKRSEEPTARNCAALSASLTRATC